MRKLRLFFLWFLAILLLVIVALSIILYSRYGGGKTYDDYQIRDAFLSESDLKLFFQYDEPIGNVAATQDSVARVFFTVHPESRPKENKLCEIVDGKAVPYPNMAFQNELITPLGVFADLQNRLWVIDHGNHALSGARLLAFDLNTNELILNYQFPSKVAETGSFLNDLTVSPDGKWVYVADVSFFAKQPSLIVYDVANQRSRSLLDGHPSVTSQGYIPVTPTKKMSFLGGLVNLSPGIDGLDINPRGSYVYYAAMSHNSLYRIPVNISKNFDLSEEVIAGYVERVSEKPLSDGIRVDEGDIVYLTDIEHQCIDFVDGKGKLRTLIRSKRIRWADGFSIGGDGFIYLADSDIPNQMLRSKKHIQANAPYNIFRFPSKWY